MARPGSADMFEKQIEYKQKLEEKVHKTEEKLEKEEKLRKQVEEKQLRLLQEKNELLTQLEAEKGHVGEVSDKLNKVSSQKQDLESQLGVSFPVILLGSNNIFVQGIRYINVFVLLK